LSLEVFTQRNFAADFFRQKLNFTGKTAKSLFVPPFGKLRVTYTVHLWLVGKGVIDFLLVLIGLFAGSHGWDALSGYWAITWLCLRDPTFSRFDTILACDRHTYRHTHRHTM